MAISSADRPSACIRRAAVRASADSAGFQVRALTSSPPTLEELFLRHYGDVLENGR